VIPSVLAMAANRILLFGDTSDAPVAPIRQLLAKSRHSNNTQLFIRNAVEAVGQEIQDVATVRARFNGSDSQYTRLARVP